MKMKRLRETDEDVMEKKLDKKVKWSEKGPCWICGQVDSRWYRYDTPFCYPLMPKDPFDYHLCEKPKCLDATKEKLDYRNALVFRYVVIPLEWKGRQIKIPRSTKRVETVQLLDGGLYLDHQDKKQVELVFHEKECKCVKWISWRMFYHLNKWEWLCPLSPQNQELIFSADESLLPLL
jgi:hypothetical protein